MHALAERDKLSSTKSTPNTLAEKLRPHLNSVIVCMVVGTSNRRTSSVAACTDHAKRDGIPFIRRTAPGEGPTVDTEILLFAMANVWGCVSTSRERVTANGLSSGSPIPM